jgi:hypothetical protein
VKLCGDGTYKFVADGWALTTLGVISKNYKTGEKDKMSAFRSTFNPLVFAFMNVENEPNYKDLLNGGVHVAAKLFGADWAEDVKQHHCDWHKGEEKARETVLKSSIRCGDWAHFIGATTRPKQQLQQQLNTAEQESAAAWRNGAWTTAKKHLSARAPLSFLKSWICLMKNLPTLNLFHTFLSISLRP